MAQLPGHNREGEKQDSSEERGFSTTVTLKKKKNQSAISQPENLLK